VSRFGISAERRSLVRRVWIVVALAVAGCFLLRRLWVGLVLAAAGLLGGAPAVSGVAQATSVSHRLAPRPATHGRVRRAAHSKPARARRPTIGQCPSPVPGATEFVGHQTYALEGMDTFTKAAPLGSFAQTQANHIVYTGDHGMHWTGYPDGWPSTYSGHVEGYQPSTVLSVHNGMLDFHLHNDTHGNPVGADPSPLPGGNRYQTYGAWSLCERVAPADYHNLADFHQATLLWPVDSRNWLSAESDFPEQDLDTLDFAGYSHYGGSGAQQVFDIQAVTAKFDSIQWHVYTQVWGPGFRSYYVDGHLAGTSTRQVWSGPERWQLQVEPTGINDGDSGHVYVKWVWIGATLEPPNAHVLDTAGR